MIGSNLRKRLPAGAMIPFLLLTLSACDSRPAGTPPAPMAEAVPSKGPHSGRLLVDGEFELEVTIYESGVPPEFRVYAYSEGKALDPSSVTLSVEVHRLGGRVDKVSFKQVGDYLRGDKEIYEPHSFEVKVVARWRGKEYRLGFTQFEARTEIAPEMRASAEIEIEEAGPRKLQNILDLSAEIALNPDQVAHIVPRFDGVITEVRKSLGDSVAKGEVVAVMESQELAEAKLAYAQSTHRLAFSQAAFERAKQLKERKISAGEEFLARRQSLEHAQLEVSGSRQTLRALGLPAEEIESLSKEQTDEVNLARYEIRAPQAGVVIERDVSLGEAVKEDAEIFSIADMSTVLAKVTVHGNDLRSVRVGQHVTVASKALDAQVEGKIAYIGPLVGTKARTTKAHVVIPNPEGLWRPGLYATVQLVEGEFTVPVAVREESVQTLRDWQVVFLHDGNLFEALPIELGRRSGGWVEVLSGLSAGTSYVSKNSFLIKADILKSGATHDH